MEDNTDYLKISYWYDPKIPHQFCNKTILTKLSPGLISPYYASEILITSKNIIGYCLYS